MDEELKKQVATSLETQPELLPFMAELLADVEALGSSPAAVVNLLRSLGLPRATALDLGCGKGAISICVARELGWHVHGVDAFQPFIDHAKQTASESGVASLCKFTCDDMRNVARSARSYDAVIYAAHGPLLDEVPCVDLLRQCVRAGGYIVIDDGFLRENVTSVPNGYESYLPQADTVKKMTAHGDRLIREEVYSAEERNNIERQTTASIRARAEALAARHPEATWMFLEYVKNLPSDATAWSCRDATWSMVIAGISPKQEDAQAISKWAKDYWNALQPHTLGAAYVNFMMDDEGNQRIKATYAENYQRLAQVKTKYDPENVFRVNQNISPSMANA